MHVVDGGFCDNSGAVSAMDLLRQRILTPAFGVRLVVT